MITSLILWIDLLQEMAILLPGKNFRPCTLDLVPVTFKKLRMNLLPKYLLFHLFCSKIISWTGRKCRMCRRFFAFNNTFAHEISSNLSDGLHILKKTEKISFVEGKFYFFKKVKITYFKLDLYYPKTIFFSRYR